MIYCVIPAAGESSRFPWNKLLYIYDEKPLIVRTVENIVSSGVVDRVIVVTGHNREEVQRVLIGSELLVDVVYNPNYKMGGMSSSIKVGVTYALEKHGVPDWLMINPADVAWVHPGVYTLIASRLPDAMNKYKIVVAGYKGIKGHPILFSREIVNDVLSISEERRGLKEVVEKYRYETLVVETNYPGVVLDFDTLHDIVRVKNTLYK